MTSRSKAQRRAIPDVRSRIAHFKDLKFTSHGHLDTYIPGNERELVPVIGPGVLEDPSLRPAIVTTDGFNVTYVRCEPGNGNALHDHETVEVFIPLTGKWKICWGEHGEQEAILEPWDVISIPPGVHRNFRNVGDKLATMIAIIGGNDSGKVIWAPQVLEEAKRHGASLDEHGFIVEHRK
jgi:quercetin dioxygenase-like cupin family protein